MPVQSFETNNKWGGEQVKTVNFLNRYYDIESEVFICELQKWEGCITN